MANLTASLNVNVDAENKEKATNILKDLGLNMSTAINMFLVQIIKRDGLPFEVINRNPSREIIEAIKEAEDIIKNPSKYPAYNNRKDLKDSLLSDD